MLDNVVVPIATQFGVQEEYAYLKTSIAQFPTGTQQERLALDEGFPNTVHYEIAGGLMGVLVITR
jgi:ubiquinone/menaquinone biosynthesis C-methylase UbiE